MYVIFDIESSSQDTAIRQRTPNSVARCLLRVVPGCQSRMGVVMSIEALRELIKDGDVEGVRGALVREPGLANRTIRWFLNQENESDPLHFVSDCVGHG